MNPGNKVGMFISFMILGVLLYIGGSVLNCLINYITPYEGARILMKALMPGVFLGVMALIISD